MSVLTRAAILESSDLPVEAVDVPEWGGTVSVRTLTGAERDRFELEVLGSSKQNIRARLCAYAMADDSGMALFTPADVEALGRKSAAALDRVFTAAMRLNAIGGQDVEGLAKNS